MDGAAYERGCAVGNVDCQRGISCLVGVAVDCEGVAAGFGNNLSREVKRNCSGVRTEVDCLEFSRIISAGEGVSAFANRQVSNFRAAVAVDNNISRIFNAGKSKRVIFDSENAEPIFSRNVERVGGFGISKNLFAVLNYTVSGFAVGIFANGERVAFVKRANFGNSAVSNRSGNIAGNSVDRNFINSRSDAFAFSKCNGAGNERGSFVVVRFNRQAVAGGSVGRIVDGNSIFGSGRGNQRVEVGGKSAEVFNAARVNRKNIFVANRRTFSEVVAVSSFFVRRQRRNNFVRVVFFAGAVDNRIFANEFFNASRNVDTVNSLDVAHGFFGQFENVGGFGCNVVNRDSAGFVGNGELAVGNHLVGVAAKFNRAVDAEECDADNRAVADNNRNAVAVFADNNFAFRRRNGIENLDGTVRQSAFRVNRGGSKHVVANFVDGVKGGLFSNEREGNFAGSLHVGAVERDSLVAKFNRAVSRRRGNFDASRSKFHVARNTNRAGGRNFFRVSNGAVDRNNLEFGAADNLDANFFADAAQILDVNRAVFLERNVNNFVADIGNYDNVALVGGRNERLFDDGNYAAFDAEDCAGFNRVANFERFRINRVNGSITAVEFDEEGSAGRHSVVAVRFADTDNSRNVARRNVEGRALFVDGHAVFAFAVVGNREHGVDVETVDSGNFAVFADREGNAVVGVGFNGEGLLANRVGDGCFVERVSFNGNFAAGDGNFSLFSRNSNFQAFVDSRNVAVRANAECSSAVGNNGACSQIDFARSKFDGVSAGNYNSFFGRVDGEGVARLGDGELSVARRNRNVHEVSRNFSIHAVNFDRGKHGVRIVAGEAVGFAVSGERAVLCGRSFDAVDNQDAVRAEFSAAVEREHAFRRFKDILPIISKVSNFNCAVNNFGLPERAFIFEQADSGHSVGCAVVGEAFAFANIADGFERAFGGCDLKAAVAVFNRNRIEIGRDNKLGNNDCAGVERRRTVFVNVDCERTFFSRRVSNVVYSNACASRRVNFRRKVGRDSNFFSNFAGVNGHAFKSIFAVLRQSIRAVAGELEVVAARKFSVGAVDNSAGCNRFNASREVNLIVDNRNVVDKRARFENVGFFAAVVVEDVAAVGGYFEDAANHFVSGIAECHGAAVGKIHDAGNETFSNFDNHAIIVAGNFNFVGFVGRKQRIIGGNSDCTFGERGVSRALSGDCQRGIFSRVRNVVDGEGCAAGFSGNRNRRGKSAEFNAGFFAAERNAVDAVSQNCKRVLAAGLGNVSISCGRSGEAVDNNRFAGSVVETGEVNRAVGGEFNHGNPVGLAVDSVDSHGAVGNFFAVPEFVAADETGAGHGVFSFVNREGFVEGDVGNFVRRAVGHGNVDIAAGSSNRNFAFVGREDAGGIAVRRENNRAVEERRSFVRRVDCERAFFSRRVSNAIHGDSRFQPASQSQQ